MKIKCPLCYKSISLTASHFYNKHEEPELDNAFAELLFKIHEKIEQVGESPLDKYRDYEVESILESLLENEK